MNIIIGADLVATRSNAEYFEARKMCELFGDKLYNTLFCADYRIFNCEIPLTDKASPIDKNGPSLFASAACANGYADIKADLLTLANNHILDQGADGLYSTRGALDALGIACVGAAENAAHAAEPHIFECDGKKIGVYACAEHEFSVAGKSTAGANPFDALESPDHVVALKEKCDYVIVLYHGGKECYRYPSPNLQKTCRKLVERGADLVVCQHSHCIGCEEDYLGGKIVYGQGNFLFDNSHRANWETSLKEFWSTGFLINITDGFKVSYIPLIKHANAVRIAEGKQAEKILSEFVYRSEKIKQDGFIDSEYDKLADKTVNTYLGFLAAVKKNFLYRALDKLTGRRYGKWLIERKYTKQKALILQNYFECEAHRELIIRGLSRKYK